VKPCILFTSAFIFLFVSCSTITSQIYKLETPLLPEQSSIKIALIADLHSTIHGKEQSILTGMIKDINPDLIVLAGDIFDDVVPMKGTRLLLSGISGTAPIYYVTGNHEYMSRDIAGIRRELLSFGVIILQDTYEKIIIKDNEIILAGIEDPYRKKFEVPGYNQNEAMETAFRELDEIPLYKILIAHRPELIETYRQYSFDLVLSGHTHGGQIIIPNILNGLYVPHQGVFPKYGGGIYTHGNLTHIISRGLSVSPFLPRIFNPPELVIVIINSAD